MPTGRPPLGPLHLHPARDHRTFAGHFSYGFDGTIESKDHQDEVDYILNLNCRNLKYNRRLVFDQIVRSLANADITRLKHQLSIWESHDPQGQRLEYAGVALYLLRRAIKIRESKAARTRKKSPA